MMHLSYKLVIFVSAFSIAVGEIKEQNTKMEDTFVMWYPIRLKLGVVKQKFNETSGLLKPLELSAKSLALYLHELQNLQAAIKDANDMKTNKNEKYGDCNKLPLKTTSGYQQTSLEEELQNNSSNNRSYYEPVQYSTIQEKLLYSSTDETDSNKLIPNEEKSSSTNENNDYEQISYMPFESKIESSNYKIIDFVPSNETPIYNKTTNYLIYANVIGEFQTSKSSDSVPQIDEANKSSAWGSLLNTNANHLPRNEYTDPDNSTANNVIISVDEIISPTESSEDGNKVELLTFKITVVNKDSPLNETEKEIKNAVSEHISTRLFNTVSTPLPYVIATSISDDAALDIKRIKDVEVREEKDENTEAVTGKLGSDSLDIQVPDKTDSNKAENNSKHYIPLVNQIKVLNQNDDEDSRILILSYKMVDSKENESGEEVDESFKYVTETTLSTDDDSTTIQTPSEYLNINIVKNSNKNGMQNLQGKGKNLNKKLILPNKDASKTGESTNENDENAESAEKHEERQHYSSENKEVTIEKIYENSEKLQYNNPNADTTTVPDENDEENLDSWPEKLYSDFTNNKKLTVIIDLTSNNSKDLASVLALRRTPVTEADYSVNVTKLSPNVDKKDNKTFGKNFENDDLMNNHVKDDNPLRNEYSNMQNKYDSNSENIASPALIKKSTKPLNNSDNYFSQLHKNLQQLSLRSNGSICKCMYHLLHVLLQNVIQPKLPKEVPTVRLIETSTSLTNTAYFTPLPVN